MGLRMGDGSFIEDGGKWSGTQSQAKGEETGEEGMAARKVDSQCSQTLL